VLLAVDPTGERLVNSGLLCDVRVTADPRLNVVIVHAPAESMDLLAALIRQLDTPGAAAQIKVFRIVNGDANAVATMLRSLVPTGGAAGPPLAAAEGESSLVPMRFSVDSRTNSIIAVGSPGDLHIIEALIVRLDEQDVQQRQTAVYRLKNAPANDVATAINDFLRSQRQLQQAAPGALSPFQQLESEVVVVPEPVSNALILSATPRFFQEIADLIEKLDAQPPQVMIQVLIAEVALNDTDEFGVELGLQDSLLFDRSLLSGNLATITSTVQQSTPSGIITSTTQSTPFATLNPGFNFNNEPLGNSGSPQSLATASKVGTQGLTSFSVGRMNNELGFGGLVLSASSESVSVLIRALQSTRRLEILSRPQIMTLDNQPAFIQIGQRVPRISSTGIVQTGQFNSIDLVNVGLILGVTPRISPEGMVVMEVDAENSNLGPIAEGIPVSVSGGEIIRSPTINTTMAQTTVSAADGETIVLGGLISKGRTRLDRRVPYLADIPVLGTLFQYHSLVEKRSELLIVLTPHIVRTPEDAERIKRMESARMTWCLGDVQEIHGEAGLTRQGGAPEVIYPDVTPRGTAPARSGWEKISPQGTAPPSNGREPAPRDPARLPPATPGRMRPAEPGGPAQGESAPPEGAAPMSGAAGLPVPPAAGPLIGNPLRPADRPHVSTAQQIPAYEPYAER
jgi:type II secretion system protein D